MQGEGPPNVWGEIVTVQDGKILPIMCGHGGSMWFCHACGEAALKSGYGMRIAAALATGAENTIPSWFPDNTPMELAHADLMRDLSRPRPGLIRRLWASIWRRS